MHSGQPGTIGLPPPTTAAQRPNQPSQLEVPHLPMLPPGRLPPPYRGLTESLRWLALAELHPLG